MSKPRIVTAVLVALLLPALAGAAGNEAAGGASRIISGELGTLGEVPMKDGAAVRDAAQRALDGILSATYNPAGSSKMVATDVVTGKAGAVHVRFAQELNGMPVAGAGMMLHARADGSIFGVNGEFVGGKDLPMVPKLDAETAIEFAIGKAAPLVSRLGGPELTYVLGTDGKGHLAWKVTVAYKSARGPHRDAIFADAVTGELVARHPQIYYARDLETRDCKQKSRCNTVVSTSPNPISTGDQAIDDAHNYAIATYDYYLNKHGRDSIDDAGMTLISRVHYNRNYNNAFWDGTQMTYGDGDGVTFIPLSQDADVVAHELTHGVTERSSGLIYQNESGALNEAWSDIFGAMVDRQEGATGADIWLIGEDIYTPAIPGDALRDMACPSCVGDYDYYPTRYTGTSDNGGVHWNSGIANLAFQLLVDGGQHPVPSVHQANGGVVVPGIGFDAAADIFYAANVSCLTPSSNFAGARYCTADVHGGSNAAAVHLAWDAVGVPNDPPPPPNPPIAISDGVPETGQDAATGNIQSYTLGVAAGSTVTCTTSCNNGDADLYLRFGQEAEANPNSTVNECGSYSSNSNESCTTGATPSADTLFATVHAYAGYTNLTITCTETTGGSCDPAGSPCGNCCNGCSGGKPSTRVCL